MNVQNYSIVLMESAAAQLSDPVHLLGLVPTRQADARLRIWRYVAIGDWHAWVVYQAADERARNEPYFVREAHWKRLDDMSQIVNPVTRIAIGASPVPTISIRDQLISETTFSELVTPFTSLEWPAHELDVSEEGLSLDGVREGVELLADDGNSLATWHNNPSDEWSHLKAAYSSALDVVESLFADVN